MHRAGVLGVIVVVWLMSEHAGTRRPLVPLAVVVSTLPLTRTRFKDVTAKVTDQYKKGCLAGVFAVGSMTCNTEIHCRTCMHTNNVIGMKYKAQTMQIPFSQFVRELPRLAVLGRIMAEVAGAMSKH